MLRATTKARESRGHWITLLPWGLWDSRTFWVAADWDCWEPQVPGRQTPVTFHFVPPGAPQDANSPHLPVLLPAQHGPLDTREYGSPQRAAKSMGYTTQCAPVRFQQQENMSCTCIQHLWGLGGFEVLAQR